MTSSVNLYLVAPLSGTLRSIEESIDPVFSGRLIGDGITIDPEDSLVLAPCDGTISQLHDAKHAIAIKTDSGLEVLIHVGVDTVILKGDGFEAYASIGDKVTVGQKLLSFNAKVIDAKAASLQTAMMITTGETGVVIHQGSKVIAGETKVFAIGANVAATLASVVVAAVVTTAVVVCASSVHQSINPSIVP
ncbi:MAG: PTS sugar transporter subunit IIA, partial [Endozoicomonas sp.]